VIPGNVQLSVGDLPGRLEELPKHQEVWTISATGYRAAIAASLVARGGDVFGVSNGGNRCTTPVCPGQTGRRRRRL
jgi:hypothetical protein